VFNFKAVNLIAREFASGDQRGFLILQPDWLDAPKIETEEAPKLFIQQHHRDRSIQLAEFSVQERYVLGLIRRSQDYTPNILLDAWREYQAKHRPRRSFAIAELYEAFYARQVK
jgi:hypothetical protein